MTTVLVNNAFEVELIDEFNSQISSYFEDACIDKTKGPNGITLKKLRFAYKQVKNLKNWTETYKGLGNLDIWNDILSIQAPKLLKKLNYKPVRSLNHGIRIMEFQSERSYPLHQEWPDMETENFVVLWCPLHKINQGDGCLLIEQIASTEKIEHIYNHLGYPIISEDNSSTLKLDEVPMQAGDCLIFDPLCVHGSAKMRPDAEPRFCFLIRYEIDPS